MPIHSYNWENTRAYGILQTCPTGHFNKSKRNMGTYTTHPVSIVAYVGSILMIVGGFMKWITVAEDSLGGLVAEEISSAVGTKMTMVWVLGIIALVLAFLASKKGSKGMLGVNLVLALLTVVPLSTGYISADDPSAILLGLEGMSAGFYLAFIGMLLLLVGSIAGLVMFKKGGAAAPKKEEA